MPWGCRKVNDKGGAQPLIRNHIPHPEEFVLGLNFATLAPIGLLLASNVFMTFAWYGHLKFPGMALWVAVMTSWGIAFIKAMRHFDVRAWRNT